MPNTWDPYSVPPENAVRRLVEGNRRFRDGTSTNPGRAWSPAMATTAQRPFAIVLGCSDSRMPVEIVFDQGFGDLFVVRVAGNIVAPSLVGSIEFAASQFGTRLVVVMGHTRCGAVTATLQALETGHGPESKNLRAITDRIAPHVETLLEGSKAEAVLERAVRANVRASVAQLQHGSRMIEDLVVADRLVIVGAVYDLDTGLVNFITPVTTAPSP